MNNKGLTIIEIILAITIFSIFSISIFYLSLDNITKENRSILGNEALLYAQEGIEATKYLRDKNFLLLQNGDHGLEIANNSWTFIPAPEEIDGFYQRTVTIEDVFRDENGNIAQTGALDPDTKKVTSEVSWLEKEIIPKSVVLTTYLSNWTGDDSITTTCNDFDAGTYDFTESISTPAPPDNNCALTLTLSEVENQFFESVDIGDHGNDVTVNANYAYMANAKQQTGLTTINVSDPANPVITSNLDISGKGKEIIYSNNYLYMGVENNSKGLAIINTSNPSAPTLTKSVNIGNAATALAINGNHLYVGADTLQNSLKILDVTNKSNPTIISQYNFGSPVLSLSIDGNYLYVGLDDDWNGLRILDISNPQAPTEISQLSVGEEVNTITISGPYAYLGIETAESFKVLNINDPLNPSVVSTLNINGEIVDLHKMGNYIYAAVDSQNAGLAAINIENPLSPYLVYTSDLTAKATGITADENNIYVSLNTANKGLVLKGTTIAELTSEGNYFSNIINTGSIDTRYNFIEWETVEIPGAQVSFQIRFASSEAGIANANWVGHDGTPNTNYTISRTAITPDPTATGQQFFQVKAHLNSNGSSNPEVESIRVNFTP